MLLYPVSESVAEMMPNEPALATKDPTRAPISKEIDEEVAAFHREVFQTGPVGSISSSALPTSSYLPKKMLNPGRPSDLWWLYESCPGALGCYSTFKRVWRDQFRTIMGFRAFGQHSCCTDCSVLQSKIRVAQSEEEKKNAGARYRQHLREQWRDRQLYAKVKMKSREKNGEMLTIIIDGADQARFRVFKHFGPIELQNGRSQPPAASSQHPLAAASSQPAA